MGGGFGTANGPNQKRASIFALISSFAPVFCICFLVGKQVALFGHWLAEAKCHANTALPHFLKGRPNTIYDFTVSCKVFRTSII
jgi:hypothetical protein